MASGEPRRSYCLSEADAGSDVASMRTRAVRDGDDYVLTGAKHWITNAGVSDTYTVFAVTDPDARPPGDQLLPGRGRTGASRSATTRTRWASAAARPPAVTFDERPRPCRAT